MKKIHILLMVVLSARFAASSHGAPLNTTNGNKFLIVVNTSSSMNRLEHGGRQPAFDLIHTGVFRQMRAGDSFGVWTFNDEVSAGVFPMQVWDPEYNLELATHTSQFLKHQTYRGKGNLDRALIKSLGLAKSVKDLTILIVSDGDALLEGMMLNPAIKKIYDEQAAAARKAKKPFVMSLAAKDGEVIDIQFSQAGQKFVLPEAILARKAPPAPPVIKAPAPVVVQAPRPQPIIMIGNSKKNNVLITTNSVTVPVPNLNITPGLISSPSSPNPDTNPTFAVVVQSSASTNAGVAAAAPPVQPATKQPPIASNKPDSSATPVAAREHSEGTVRSESPGIGGLPYVTKSSFQPSPIVWLGGSLILLAVGIVLWVLLRVRSTSQPSFISQSMGRQ